MSKLNSSRWVTFTVALSTLLAIASLVAVAQDSQIRDAGSKIRDGGMAHGAQMYQRHAQDRSRILYYYSQSQQPIPKTEAKELVTGIKNDLTSADKALAKLKEQYTKDAEVAKLIASIEKHHAKAQESCGMAEDHALKSDIDPHAVSDCCSEMWHEIDAAHAETSKLLKLLKIEKLAPPKPVSPKK